MSHEQGRGTPHTVPSNLGWPLVVMVLGLLATITVVSVTGGDLKGLTDILSTLLSALGAAGGIGAWVNSTRAARQTNGVLDDRMTDAVHEGLNRALDEARQTRR